MHAPDWWPAFVTGVLVPTESAVLLFVRLGGKVVSLVRTSLTRKEVSPMPLNLGSIEQAFAWIAANPVVVKEGEDAAKLGLDLIVGNKAGITPDLKQMVVDASFPAPWNEILSSDAVVDGIAAFFITKAQAQNAAALEAPKAPQS